MRIALDYDKTFTLDPDFWSRVIILAEASGHEVFCMTMRRPEESIEMPCPIHYTSRRAKVPHAKENKIKVDVWIDDAPHWLLFDG